MASQRRESAQPQGRRVQLQERTADRGRPQALRAANLPDLVHPDLALPANALMRGQLLRALQRSVGNQTLQRTLLGSDGPVPRAVSSEVLARVPTTTQQGIDVQRPRAGTPGAPWATLNPAQRQQVLGLIQSNAHGAAVQAMWEALRRGLAEAGRVDVELAASMGEWGGTAIAPAQSDLGVTLIYVPRRSECAGAAPAAHLQLHQAADLRFLVQISSNLFRIDPQEAVARLQTTLMHEYVHVEQQMARGIEENFHLRPVGDREFITQTGATTAPSRQLEALDEIEAPCAEIENAERTGLALSFDLRTAINLAWSKYQDYYGATNGQPDRAVATRVYRNIQHGRRLFAAYLRSPRSSWMRGGQALMYRMTPPGYNEQQILPFVDRAAVAPATSTSQASSPATSPATP